MSKYEFDAAHWCESMKIAHFRNKDFATAENFKQTRMEIEALRARLAEAEAQRDGLKESLELISSGDYKNAATNCFAAVAVGIANRALAKLEEK